MSVLELLSKDLIFLDLPFETEESIFAYVSDHLLEMKYVNEDYFSGIKEREEAFPTGLMTPYLNIALPHADTKYVRRPFLGIVTLQNAIDVRQMGDNQMMPTKYLFFLGIKEPEKQVGLLQLMMTLFQDEHFVEALQKIDDVQSMFMLMEKNIKKLEEN